MSEFNPSDFELQTCSKCGATNDPSATHCRKCDTDLAKSQEFFIPMWVVAVAVIFIVFIVAVTITGVVFEEGAFVAILLMGLAAILGVIGWFWLLIEAFRENVIWGVACFIFVPFAQLAFLFIHPGRAFKPFSLSVLSIFLVLIASFFVPILPQ